MLPSWVSVFSHYIGWASIIVTVSLFLVSIVSGIVVFILKQFNKKGETPDVK